MSDGTVPPERRPARFGEWLQGRALAGLLVLFGALPLDTASALGGAIARAIGPRLRQSGRARQSLAQALPGLPPAEVERAIGEMWDNLGRVLAEYPHLARLRCFGPDSPVEVIGTEHLDRATAQGRAAICFSGHFGNWELPSVAATQYGLDFAVVYRAVGNPAIEAILHGLRRSYGAEPISKGASGARRIIAAIKARRTLGILVDQKMNDGIAVPFLGRDAMTAPAIAELALRYDCALLPLRVERLGGARFRVTLLPPVEPPRSADRQADIRATMAAVNQILETWIRERPGQWFWLHRRWPDS